MKYLINNEVTFRSDDGVLINLNHPENAVTLSITANRILTYLLEQEGKVVSREEMFVNIWDKNGLQASNNSLSQYISLIRKYLLELGCEQEIIQTVPRVGFFIAEGLVKMVEADPFTADSGHPAPISITAAPVSTWAKAMSLAVSCIASLMLIYPVGAFLNTTEKSLPVTQTFMLGFIDKCPVYTLYQNSPALAPTKLAQARKLAGLHLPCITGAEYFFQPDDLYVYGDKGRVFLSRCTFSNVEKTRFAGCKDIYIHEY